MLVTVVTVVVAMLCAGDSGDYSGSDVVCW